MPHRRAGSSRSPTQFPARSSAAPVRSAARSRDRPARSPGPASAQPPSTGRAVRRERRSRHRCMGDRFAQEDLSPRMMRCSRDANPGRDATPILKDSYGRAAPAAAED